MIEVSGIRVPLAKVAGPADEPRAYTAAVLRRLHLQPDDLTSTELRRRSVDARKKGQTQLVYTLRATLRGGANAERSLLARLSRRHEDRGIRKVEPDEPGWPLPLTQKERSRSSRPVVVGAGCAGLFCALALAEAGLEPLLVERGDDATRRTQVVAGFDRTGRLDPESNIQFGLGGAGTFSDGKLSTGTKSPLHRLVLRTFVEAGASPQILWDSHPHVGSDVLPAAVTHIRERIEELGGEVHCRCRMTDIELAGEPGGSRVCAVTLLETRPDGSTYEERVPARDVVLACGHSARDVFALLGEKGVALERKTFAMGVRIEHLQASVDRCLWGPDAGNPLLGAAPYKLVAHLPQAVPEVGGRSAFSFCMCPGGYVVAAASERGGVVTNGMSLAARDGVNANSGFLANVFPEDLPGTDPLAGIELQRQCERRAFELGGGGYAAPAQLVGDFLAGRPSTGAGSVTPTYPRGVTWGSVEGCLPGYVTATLRTAIPLMARRLRCFDQDDAVLTGVETRSSSPVRVTRDADLQSVGCAGLWPCGEGAGYAGGIMSAATDGLRVAAALADSRRL